MHLTSRLIALALAGLPFAAHAQVGPSCAAPDILPRPHLEEPSDAQPARTVPIGGYTLSLIWQPQQCYHPVPGTEATACGKDGPKGFTLHGLWPDGYDSKTWPQYCRPAAILPPATIRNAWCATPSTQLIQHEWAKHGTCMGSDPEMYFAQSGKLFRALKFPDMAALSRRATLNAGDLAAAIAAANPSMKAGMMRITANKVGWLEEVWVCLDKALKYKVCPMGSGGLPDKARVKITRPD